MYPAIIPVVRLLVAAALVTIASTGGGPAAVAQIDKDRGEGEAGTTGLIAEGEYESPQFGYAVEFPDEWDAETIGYPISDADAGQDELLLYNRDVYGEVRIIGRAEGRGGPAADVEFWSTDDYLDGYLEAHLDYRILATPADEEGDTAGLLMAEVRHGEPETMVHYFQSLVLDDDTPVVLIVIAYAGDFPAVLESARNGIEIDGSPAFDLLSGAELDRALDDAPETLQTDEDAGLVAPGSYEGPAHGHDVAWDDPWVLDPTADPAVRSSLFLSYDELYLAQLDDEGEPVAVLAVTGGWFIDGDAQDYLGHWSDEDVLTAYWGDEYTFEVLLAEDDGNQFGVLVEVIDEEGEVAYYDYTSAIILGDDSIVTLTFASYPDVFEDAFAALAGEITVNDEPIFPFAGWDEIEDLMRP